MKKTLWVVLCLFVYKPSIRAQNCPQELDFSFTPSQHGINWYQFPEFDLPFKIVYGASREIYDPSALLARGFTHISNHNWYGNLPKNKRVYIFYNIADLPNQPWKTHKSPYGNDLEAYKNWWLGRLEDVKQQNEGNLDFDIFCIDIEHYHKSRDSIIALKNESFVPAVYKTLGDEAFIMQYQKDMQTWYGQVATFFKQEVKANQFTSYGDVPIFNTFTNILGPSWTDWQTKPELLSFINYDYEKKTTGGSFYNTLDILTPSAYFYYDYPHLFAGEYLSYLMFQIEANKVWSPKEQMVFLWNKYSYTPQYLDKNIKPWMSEAMAVFPFFSGVKGVWLWDNFMPTNDFSGYEYFMKGLYRLSKFKEFFTGNFQLIQNPSAWELNDKKLPVWRGVYKEGKLLVAAHNPWAKSETEEVTITVRYGNLNKQISLKGFEIFLCEYPADLVTLNEIELLEAILSPNPAAEKINFKLSVSKPEGIVVNLFNLQGNLLRQEIVPHSHSTTLSGSFDLTSIPPGEYLISFRNSTSIVSKKIIISP